MFPAIRTATTKGIHSNNTRHDDGDERLLSLALIQHARHSRGPASSCLRTFMMRSDLKVPTPAITNARLGRAVCCSYACSAS